MLFGFDITSNLGVISTPTSVPRVLVLKQCSIILSTVPGRKRYGIFSRLISPAFWALLFLFLFILCFFLFPLYNLPLLCLYFVILLLVFCFKFGMFVIRQLLGIVASLSALLLILLLKIFNFEFVAIPLIGFDISGLLIVVFVR